VTGDNTIQSITGEKLKTAKLIILQSPDGEYPWTAVKPEDCPEWLKSPRVAAMLVEGNMVQNTIGGFGAWYRGEPMPVAPTDPAEVH
jgi:hypothetical protein